MRASDKNLTVLSEAESVALYGLPDFDDFQRAEYFALTDEERTLTQRRNGVPEKILCMLQLGYFKAKQAFFNVSFASGQKLLLKSGRLMDDAGTRLCVGSHAANCLFVGGLGTKPLG